MFGGGWFWESTTQTKNKGNNFRFMIIHTLPERLAGGTHTEAELTKENSHNYTPHAAIRPQRRNKRQHPISSGPYVNPLEQIL